MELALKKFKFTYLDLALIFVGKLVDNRPCHLAWSTPRRPKIYHHGCITLDNMLVKVIVSKCLSINSCHIFPSLARRSLALAAHVID